MKMANNMTQLLTLLKEYSIREVTNVPTEYLKSLVSNMREYVKFSLKMIELQIRGVKLC